MVSLRSGTGAVVSVRGSDGSLRPHLFKSVVAMQHSGSESELTVLGMADDGTPSWQKWLKGPKYEWTVWKVRASRGGLL